MNARAHCCPRLALLGLLCVLVPVLAWANAARLADDGTLAGEPEGLLGVTIARETLTMDLRGIATTRVEAVYRLENRGPRQRLELAFVTGEPASNLEAQLDGHALATRLVPLDPEQRPVRPEIPRIGGGTWHHLMDPPEQLRAFTLELPPGEHELVVRYEGLAGNDQTCTPTQCWTFAYMLAPARTWAKFGELEATILVPPGWEIAVDPPFEREGDVLHARFSELPADVIGATLQAPTPFGYRGVVAALWLLYGAAALGGGWVTLRSGAWWHVRRGSIVPVIVVPLWTASMVFAGWLTIVLPRAMISGAQAPRGGYDDLWPLAAVLVCVPLGIVLAIIGAHRHRPRDPS